MLYEENLAVLPRVFQGHLDLLVRLFGLLETAFITLRRDVQATGLQNAWLRT